MHHKKPTAPLRRKLWYQITIWIHYLPKFRSFVSSYSSTASVYFPSRIRLFFNPIKAYPFRFFKAAGLLAMIGSIVKHVSISGHSQQVATPFFNAHFRISHICSQKTVLTPPARQPWQFMCSGRIGALFNLAHNFAVFSRRCWSSLIVAIYASHFSQSSPQYAIISFIGYNSNT